MTTVETPKVNLRDFIYIDIPRLYSMCSQLFGKIPHEHVSVRTAGKETSETATKLLGLKTESKGREDDQEIEKSYLYDHMYYNQLEAALASDIIDASDISANNLKEIFESSALVKASGMTEVEDFSRLRVIFSKWESISQALAYSGNVEAVEQLSNQLLIEKDRKALENIKAGIKKLQDLKLQAQEKGLSPDMVNIKNLDLFVETFNPDGFEILITPSHSPLIQYRAVIDRRWLRYHPDLLRSLYGGKAITPWTVVGQLTLLPSQLAKAEELHDYVITLEESNLLPGPVASMRDSVRGLFRSARFLERMFVLSKETIEVVLSPYAIYREIPRRSPRTT